MIGSLRTYIEIAAALIILAAFGWYTWHERQVGAHTIESHDATAKRTLDAAVAQQTAALQAKAQAADQGAADAQSKLDAYIAAQPLEPVRLCVAHYSGGGLSQASAPPGKAPGASPGPAPVRAVQDGTPGPDISAGLDTLVQAAAELAIDVQDFQKR